MSSLTDQRYLQNEQYKTAANLGARINLHQRFSTNHYGCQRWIFDQLDLPEEACILELGCGRADLWVDNLPRIPPGWQVTLSDLSPGMLAEAQARLGLAANRFNFQEVDAQVIPLPTASLDGVIANHMLYHLPDLSRGLAEIRRVLKPGGCLFAATNGPLHMAEVNSLAARFWPNKIWDCSLTLSFRLDNGVALLEPFFDHVSMLRYPDRLAITESAPLVEYVLSMFRKSQQVPTPEELAELACWIEGEITARGALYVTKDPGLFIARV